MEKSNSIKKVCGFYVSSVHLVTMLLPYLNKQIEEQIEVIPFLEFDLRKNVETILSKIVLNEKNKEEGRCKSAYSDVFTSSLKYIIFFCLGG